MRSPAHEPTRWAWELRTRSKPFRSQRSSGASREATHRSPFPRPLSLARRMASAVKVAPPSANSRSFCPSPRRQEWRYCCLSRLTTRWYCPIGTSFLVGLFGEWRGGLNEVVEFGLEGAEHAKCVLEPFSLLREAVSFFRIRLPCGLEIPRIDLAFGLD